MTTPNATCAYTGRELCIRGDSTYPYINLEGHGGIYFADEAAKQAWCEQNVQWNPDRNRYEPRSNTITINGSAIPVTSAS